MVKNKKPNNRLYKYTHTKPSPLPHYSLMTNILDTLSSKKLDFGTLSRPRLAYIQNPFTFAILLKTDVFQH
jgi:hypothetical protein